VECACSTGDVKAPYLDGKEATLAVSVMLFNASSLVIAISVNQGPQIAVPPTGASLDWAPQNQDPDLGPKYAPGFPAPNVIGNKGVDVLAAKIAGVPVGGTPFQFSLPADQPVGSVQIYVFFASVQSCSWLAVVDGKPIAQQMKLSGDVVML
jgi:hypothetical protein